MIFGVIATLVVLYILSSLRIFLTRLTHRAFHHVVPYLRPDGRVILEALMDSEQERDLARDLPHKIFREEQMDRIRLADEYLGHRAHNARVYQGWGDTELRQARKSGNQEKQAVARVLVAACHDYRIGLSSLQFQLHLWQFKMILLPLGRIPRITGLKEIDEFELFGGYEKIEATALLLAELCGSDYHDRLLAAL